MNYNIKLATLNLGNPKMNCNNSDANKWKFVSIYKPKTSLKPKSRFSVVSENFQVTCQGVLFCEIWYQMLESFLRGFIPPFFEGEEGGR